jgi:hypothetical protein
MKIKDILGEDDGAPMKVKSISGDEVDIDQGGTDIKAKVSDLIANPDKPGEFQMKPPPTSGQGSVQPGATVTTTSEEYEGDPDEDHPSHRHFKNWIHSEHSPFSDEAGDHNAVFMKALGYLKDYAPHDLANHEFHAHHMAKMFHGGHEFDESHDDLISQGNQDVGGDATDNYINQVRDRDFERAQGKGSEMEEDIFGFGNKSPEEWAKSSPQMAQLLQFRAKYKGTEYEAQIDKRIELLKNRLDLAGEPGAGMGPPLDAHGNLKPVVPPEKFDMKQLREADDALLEKMRVIAGLR